MYEIKTINKQWNALFLLKGRPTWTVTVAEFSPRVLFEFHLTLHEHSSSTPACCSVHAAWGEHIADKCGGWQKKFQLISSTSADLSSCLATLASITVNLAICFHSSSLIDCFLRLLYFLLFTVLAESATFSYSPNKEQEWHWNYNVKRFLRELINCNATPNSLLVSHPSPGESTCGQAVPEVLIN